jgi:hypothetical protein
MVIWINENYHLFAVDTDEMKDLLPDNPFLSALLPGVYVFTNEKMAFVVSKDYNFLTICPRKSDDGKIALSSRQMTAEVMQFVQDPRIVRFFSCENLLTRYKL